MKTLFRLLLCLPIYFGIILSQVQASHVVGGEITYTKIGNRVYELNMKLYRDCAGIQLCGGCNPGNNPGTCAQSISAAGIAPPSGVAHNLPAQTCNGTSFASTNISILPGSTIFDAVQLCNITKTICSNCNSRTPGTFTPGVEVYSFRGNVDLSSIPSSCCWVSLGVGPTCCRNSSVSTLQSPGTLAFFTDLQINTCLGTAANSGPRFENNTEVIAPAGVDFTYNLGAWDPDGDSLSYRFGPTLISRGTNAPYISPFGPSVPFPYVGAPGQSPPLLPPAGINIDPVVGTVRFRPSGTFVSNFVIEVLEWRRINNIPTLLSISRRDIQFYSQSITGGAPQLRVYKDGAITNDVTFSGCGEKCFNIVANSSGITGNDTTDLEVLSNIGNVTITRPYNVNTRATNGPRFDTLRVCVQPSNSGVNSIRNALTIIAKNRNCPLNNKTTRTILVTHLPAPNWFVYELKSGENINPIPAGFPSTFSYFASSQVPIVKDSVKWMVAQPGSNTYSSVGLVGDTSITVTPIMEGFLKIRTQLYSNSCGWVTQTDSIVVRDLNVVLNKTVDSKCVGDSNGSIIFTRLGARAPILATVAPWSVQSLPNLRPWLPVDTITGLPPGLYRLKVKDSLNYEHSITVEVKRASNPFTVNTPNITNLTCHNDSSGRVTLNITGGAASQLWWYSKDSVNWQNSPIFNGLNAGTIKFHYRDSVGCGSSTSVSINQPTAIDPGVQISEKIKCKGDASAVISLFPTGGTMPYQTRLNQGNFSSALDYYSLKADAYTITVKDNSGCLKSQNITITEPATLFEGTVTTIQPNCQTATGQVTINTQGGNAPYQYWSSFSSPGSNPVFTNLNPGNITFFARDSNQCLLSFFVTLTNPNNVLLSHTKAEIKCFGDLNGSVSLIATGGKRPYQFNMNGGSYINDSIFKNLGSGNYTFTVRDSLGCVKSLQTNLVNRTPMSIALTGTDETCIGAKNGTAKAVVTGGLAPHTNTWLLNPPVNGLQVNGLSGGVVRFMVTDFAQCVKIDSVTINTKVPYEGEVICGASFIPNTQHTQIAWNKTSGKGIFGYKVFYRLDLSSSPVELATTTFNAPSLIVDSVSPKNLLILYSIRALDSCSIPSSESKLVSAPLLTVTPNGNQTNLSWNYNFAPEGLTGFQIYKSVNNGQFLPIHLASASANSYIDTSFSFSNRIYYIEALVSPSCANNFKIYSNRVLVYPNSLTETKAANKGFMLYPNPAENWVKVQSKSTQTITEISLYNLQGQIVFTQHFDRPVLETELSLLQLPKGVYQVHITTHNGSETMPLVVN